MDIDSTDVLENPQQTSNFLDVDMMQQCHSPEIGLSDRVPKIGMKFESEDHAYNFYNTYAGLAGFSVRKDFKNRSKIDGSVMSRRFVCFKRGFRLPDRRNLNVKKPHKEVRTGCLAQMTISRQSDGKYRIIHFESNHNHEVVSLEEVPMLPSHRKVTVSRAVEADLVDKSGIQKNLDFDLESKQVSYWESLGHVPINLHSRRLRDMKLGEAGSLLSYFQKKLSENPSFFYAVQLDIDEQITNLFWADAKMVTDYNHFGDVVYFDTTYRTNQLCRPLAAFMGVNHHKEMVLFGAALVYDETLESFQWLFQTFMQAMSGKKPKTILTTHDLEITKAIGLAFPQTYHRICVWNLWQNAMQHLGYLLEDQDAFGKDFRNCIYDHEEEDQFLQSWESMLQKYGLLDNEWLQSIYKEKEKWAMVYGRRIFCADVKSTQLSERFNRCLRKHLKSDSDMLQFLNNFEKMVANLRYKEVQSHNSISQCRQILKASEALLKHAWDIYTPNAFEVFKKEFEDCCDLVIYQCNENGSLFEYMFSSFGKPCRDVVKFNSLDDKVNCSCMKFEYAGILCSHALKVLGVRNIKVVPDKYILKRWTKGARVRTVGDSQGCTVQEDPALAISSRYKDLSWKALDLSTWAAESEEGYVFLSRIFNEGMLGLERINMRKFNDSNNINAEASPSEHYDYNQDANGN